MMQDRDIVLTDLAVHRAGRCVLGPLNARVHTQGITVVLGPNGAGKTTLLRALFGLVTPSTGQAALPDGIRKAFVFQRPTLLKRSVVANAAYPLQLMGRPRAEAQNAARTKLQDAGLGDKLAQEAQGLSAGEAQKLALVRAMITDPDLVFLDEPTAHLDGHSTQAIEAILTDAKNAGAGLLMATHDLGQARRLADRVLFLAQGRICEHTDRRAFFDAPQSTEAAAFIRGDIVA